MRFKGLVYRAHSPQWSWTPLSGDGARRHGGRFNRIGVPALYTSLSPLTAIRESQPLGRPMQLLRLCAYDVDAEPVFDGMDAKQRSAYSVTDLEMRCPNWEYEMLEGTVSSSQRLADRLIEDGYVGMRVRSFAPGAGLDDINLVFWHWGDDRPSRVVVIDDDGLLPKTPPS